MLTAICENHFKEMNQNNIPTICLSDDSDEGQGPETPKNSSQKPEERRSSRRKRIKTVDNLLFVKASN